MLRCSKAPVSPLFITVAAHAVRLGATLLAARAQRGAGLGNNAEVTFALVRGGQQCFCATRPPSRTEITERGTMFCGVYVQMMRR